MSVTKKSQRSKVDPLVVDTVYLHFLLLQCEAFGDIHKRFIAALDRIEAGKRVREPTKRRAFADLQAMLITAANIGKMVWPTPGTAKAQVRAQKRGTRLRALLKIQSYPELQNRSLRNSLEHFDERLDDWARSPRDMIVNRITSDPKATAFHPKNVFGLYDPKTYIVTILGSRVNLDVLCNSVWGVHAAAGVAIQDVLHRRGLI